MFSFKSANPNRLLIRGVVSILAGITIVLVPDLTLVSVIKIVGALMLIDGVLTQLIVYFSKKKTNSGVQLIPRGMSNFIFGAVLLIFPTVMVNAFVFIIGFILLIAGFSQFAAQIRGRSILGTSWIMLLISAISFIAGIVLITKPFESAETILIIFGVIIALYGFGEVVWSFKVRKYQKSQPVSEPSIVDAEYEEIK
ncbi:MAG: HdeD family acid-resistance protein [Prolixibacteraceae bacterium]